MLAEISEGIPDAIKQLKGAPFLAEYKYDGTRAQIHLLSDNSVKVFSRNCEDKTGSMPDVVAAIQAAAEGMLPSSLLQFVLWCQNLVQRCARWHTSMLPCTTGYNSSILRTAPFTALGCPLISCPNGVLNSHWSDRLHARSTCFHRHDSSSADNAIRRLGRQPSNLFATPDFCIHT